MGLTHKAVLVSLHISKLSTNKFDAEVTRDTCKRHGTKEKWARVTKRIYETSYLENIKKIAGKARTYFYENTLPWGKDGKQMLPSKHYAEFSKVMRAFQTDFMKAVDVFIKRDADKAVAEAKVALGSMFKDSDYPTKEEMRESFGFEVDVCPVPETGDFRTDLKKEEIDSLEKARATEDTQREKEAKRELWQRLYDVVYSINEKLSEPDSIFRDTLIENGRDLVKLLPKLNVGDDVELEKMCKEVEGRLLAHDATEVRTDPVSIKKRMRKARAEKKKAWKKDQAEKEAKRQAVAEASADILDKMAGYMGGPPQNGLDKNGKEKKS